MRFDLLVTAFVLNLIQTVDIIKLYEIAKISKSNSRGIKPKVWCPYNRHNSLSSFHFFEITKSLTEKNMSISYPGIQTT